MKKQKLIALIVLPLLVASFLSACYSSASAQDTAIINMTGKDWSLKVDSTLQTSIDSANTPYVSVVKAGAEKELFLTLNSLKDCVSGQIQFKVETQGLTIYKQLPLDKELTVGEQYDFINATVAMQKDRVVVSRPENVVNSFACFDSSGQKVMHIYASKLVDAKGSEIWVDSDLKDGSLTVYLDQKWLSEAVFPVIVDPTFGYSNVGATNDGWGGILFSTSLTTMLTSVKITGLHFYSHEVQNFKLGIYNASTGYPETLFYNTTSLSGSNNAWYDITGLEIILPSGDYYLAIISDESNGLSFASDWNVKSMYYKASTFSTAMPNNFPLSASQGDYKISLYADYEIYTEPTPTPTASPTPTATVSTMTLVLGMQDWTLVFLIIALVLTIFPKYSLANFIVGIFTIMIALYAATTGTPLFGWIGTLFAVTIGIICMLRATDLL